MLIVAIPLLFGSTQIQAEQWPDHGFFVVRTNLDQRGGGLRCEMLLSLQVDKRLFALVLVEGEGGRLPLQVHYMSGDPRIAVTDKVVVKVDDTKVIAFTPLKRTTEPEIGVVVGEYRDREAAARVWEALASSSVKAEWLTVVTAVLTDRVPAGGLREALADFAQCRTRRSS